MKLLKKLSEYLKDTLERQDKKKLTENAVIVIIVGIIIMLAGGALFNNNERRQENRQMPAKEATEVSAEEPSGGDRTNLEKRLEETLAQIEGVGKVTVMITYESGEEIVPAYDTRSKDNEIREKDAGGGTRDTSEREYESKIVYVEETGGGKKPVIIKKKYPVVKGVIVVADGAGDISVRDNIIRAVQALTDVPIHKVQVFERKN